MADNKKDNVFHWNFDLKDTDSEFTDIDYSQDLTSDESTKADIEPYIFVDGNYKSNNDASSFVDHYMVNNMKGSSVQEEEDLYGNSAFSGRKNRKTASDEKEEDGSYISSRRKLRWQPILVAGAALLLIILLIILFWPKNTKKEWKEIKNTDVTELVTAYFDAKKSGDANALRTILVQSATIDTITLSIEQRIYEDFQNIRVYSYPGMEKNESALFVSYDIKYYNLDTVQPNSGWFYVRPDSSNKLRLLTSKELGTGKDSDPEKATYEYIAKAYEDSDYIKGVYQEVVTRYNAALNSDPELMEYVKQLNSGNVVPYSSKAADEGSEPTETPDETTTEASEPTTNEVTEPDSSSQAWTTNSDQGNETEVDYSAYINTNGVRMRSEPNLDADNVVTLFDTGHYLHIIGELNDWYHVQDILDVNGQGGTQECTGIDGYVYKDFITKNYGDLQWD